MKRLLAGMMSVALLILAPCGCQSDVDEEDESVASSADAITSDELAAGQGWASDSDDDDPADDVLAAEDDAAADAEDDDEADILAADDDEGLRPLDTPAAAPTAPTARPKPPCRAATGFVRGKSRRLCVVRINGKLVERSSAKRFVEMRAAARKAGVRLRVVSGFRTMAEQRYLYRRYRAGRGALAAPPGFSNHQSGTAFDLNTRAPGVYRWLSRNAGRYGFRRTVPSEAWHWDRRR